MERGELTVTFKGHPIPGVGRALNEPIEAGQNYEADHCFSVAEGGALIVTNALGQFVAAFSADTWFRAFYNPKGF